MPKFKPFTLSERISIEHSLKELLSFKEIGRRLNRDCTSISKEVKNHITIKKTGSYGRAFNDCIHRFECNRSYICDSPSCRNNYCRFCSRCYQVCSDYKEYLCPLLSKPPYVCNGCKNLKSCTLQKSFYSAAAAQNEYEVCRSESRREIIVDEEEISRLDNFISPLIEKGQSIHHICSNNRDIIMHSERPFTITLITTFLQLEILTCQEKCYIGQERSRPIISRLINPVGLVVLMMISLSF